MPRRTPERNGRRLHFEGIEQQSPERITVLQRESTRRRIEDVRIIPSAGDWVLRIRRAPSSVISYRRTVNKWSLSEAEKKCRDCK
jgi:hypothetical protein